MDNSLLTSLVIASAIAALLSALVSALGLDSCAGREKRAALEVALEAARAENAALKAAKEAAEASLAALVKQKKEVEAVTIEHKETVEMAVDPWYDTPLPSDLLDLLRSCAPGLPTAACDSPPGGASGALPATRAETNGNKP